jgi:hypothetical protein
VAAYKRTDRTTLEKRPEALPKPDFSGSWSTKVLHTVSVINRTEAPEVPTLGSGWGEKISIVQTADHLDVERISFTPREQQATVHYHFLLNGSSSENEVNMGRMDNKTTSTTTWEGNRLVITTSYPYPNPKNGQWLKGKVSQTLWLQATNSPPWEPTLVVETTREGVLGGLTTTNRTVYSKGYR